MLVCVCTEFANDIDSSLLANEFSGNISFIFVQKIYQFIIPIIRLVMVECLAGIKKTRMENIGKRTY